MLYSYYICSVKSTQKMQDKQVKNDKCVKMSCRDYYELSTKLTSALREEIIRKLNISYRTYYNKLNNDSWTPAERQMLDAIYTDHINTLVENLVA